MPVDPFMTRSIACAAYLMCFDVQPAYVCTIAPKAGTPARYKGAVEFHYTDQAACDHMAEWYRGTEAETLVPARRFDTALQQARKLANQARDTDSFGD